MSEPIEPIIYYLDNGTPEPVRSALIDGGLWWNQAFESIGFKNAFQVKMLPENADPLMLDITLFNGFIGQQEDGVMVQLFLTQELGNNKRSC